jgi:hypothetical protein
VHHLVIATVWGLLLGMVVLRLRGVTRVAAGIGVSLLSVLVVFQWLPPVLRIGFAVTSNMAGAVPIAVAMLVAVLGGIWATADS